MKEHVVNALLAGFLIIDSGQCLNPAYFYTKSVWRCEPGWIATIEYQGLN